MDIPTIHLEVCRSTAKQNIEYCKKADDQAYEIGESSGQGKRSDLLAVTKDITEGTGIREVADNYPVQFITYNKGIEKWKDTMGIGVKRDFKT